MTDGLEKQTAITEFTGPEAALRLSTTSVRNTVRQWSFKNRSVDETVFRVVDKRGSYKIQPIEFAKYAVRLSQKDLKILLGLLTELDTLNRHLTLLKIKENPTCHLCGKEYDTSLHLLERCSALIGKRRKQSGEHLLVPSELRQEHWSMLLKSAKNS